MASMSSEVMSGMPGFTSTCAQILSSLTVTLRMLNRPAITLPYSSLPYSSPSCGSTESAPDAVGLSAEDPESFLSVSAGAITRMSEMRWPRIDCTLN